MSTTSSLDNTSLEFEDSFGRIVNILTSRDTLDPLSFIDLEGSNSLTDSVQLRILSDLECNIIAKAKTGNDFIGMTFTPNLTTIQSNLDMNIEGGPTVSIIASQELQFENISGNYKWPTVTPTTGQILSSDSSGNMSWVTVGGGQSPGGILNSIQFNNPLGTFSGDSNFLFESTRLLVSKSGSITTSIPGPPGFSIDLRGSTNTSDAAGMNIICGTNGLSYIFMGDENIASSGDVFIISYDKTTGTSLIDNKLGTGGIEIKTGGNSASIDIVSSQGRIYLNSGTESKISATTDIIFQNSTGTNYIWPTVDATSNQVLSAGSIPGTMEWATVNAGSPSGTDGSIQFSDNGNFGGDLSFKLTNNGTTQTLYVSKPNSSDTPLSGIPTVGMLFDVRNTVDDTGSFINIQGTYNSMSGIILSDNISSSPDVLFVRSPTECFLSTSNTFRLLSKGNISIGTRDGNLDIWTLYDLNFQNSTGTNYIWPTVDATSNQVLSAGSTPGTMEWVTVGGGQSPGGSLNSIQFNNPSGTFSGDSNFIYDTTIDTVRLTTPGSSTIELPGLPPGANVLEVRGTESTNFPIFSIVCGDSNQASLIMKPINSNDGLNISYDPVGQVSSIVSVANTNGMNIVSTNGNILFSSQTNNIVLDAPTGDITFKNSSSSTIKLPSTAPLVNQIIKAGNTVSGNLEWTNVTIDSDNSLYIDQGGVNEIKLDATDGIIYAEEFASTSDIRLKKDIETISNCLDKILQINPTKYKWIKNNSVSYGIIAQELELVDIENIVNTNKEGMKSISYTQLIPFLIGSIKDLNNKIIKLESQMTKLL